MTRQESGQTEQDAARMAAALMAASARTAPKARGLDAIKTLVLDGEDLEKLAARMERTWEDRAESYSSYMKRDAGNIRNSACMLLIGVSRNPKGIDLPLDCGACGYGTCQGLARVKEKTGDFTGPTCVFQAMDLGIALGSAVKLAAEFNIDNRIMTTAGVAAKDLRLLDSDLIIGIPLSVSGKSPYFDRR